MRELSVQRLRNGVPESVHRVSAAVVDRDGVLAASCGDPDLVTFMRSAAKPFQALPVVQDGAVERFAMTPRELALACASHNSETEQVAEVRALLYRLDLEESDLACGPHPSLGLSFSVPPVERALLHAPSPLASNCSGKHAAMLALAQHHGWPVMGYQTADHPVQRRVKSELARWSGMAESAIAEGVDGCTVTSFALPLSRMAQAMARLVTGDGSSERAVVSAMMQHPDLVAGQGRLCTELMVTYPRRVLAKVGAEGVYVAALPDRGLGLCLKVEDGDAKAAMVALLAALDHLGLDPPPSTRLSHFTEIPLLNTRDEPVGAIRALGRLSMD